MEKAAWCFIGAMILIFGLLCFFWPATSVPFLDDEDNPRDPTAPASPSELRRARLIGVVFIVIGCLWVYLILFGKPSDDPALI